MRSVSAIVETTQGKVRGGVLEGIHFFKGMHYGGDTSGRNRFMPPTPAPLWTGVRDALNFGPRAPQEDDPYCHLPWRYWWEGDPNPESEDCLRINVYTPGVNDGRRRPVMFFMHGGGFSYGSGSSAGIDGTHLAKRGDVVVVTANHRLNAFGYLYLGATDGGHWNDASNAGTLDLIQALQWVRDNIKAFGGDPGCVTIFGQSGGGCKVGALMTMPAAAGLFHRCISQSASAMHRAFEPDLAAQHTEKLLAELGVSRNNLSALHELSMEQIKEGQRRTGLARHMRPVMHPGHLPVHPFDPVAAPQSASIPLLVGSTDHEMAYYDAVDLQNVSMSEAQACVKLKELVDTDEQGAKRLLAAYARRRPGSTPYELLLAVGSRQLFRRNLIAIAERKAAQNAAPAYVYEFGWQSPAEGGVLRSAHTICIAFVFGTLKAAVGMVGKGKDASQLSEKMMDAWTAFARTGNPNHNDLPAWRPYSAGARHTMVFDSECQAVIDRDREDRLDLDAYPMHSRDKLVKPKVASM